MEQYKKLFALAKQTSDPVSVKRGLFALKQVTGAVVFRTVTQTRYEHFGRDLN
jgi:hypothetical protein